VLVAGTNGKGSTCAFLDAILRAAGARVGLYTSPHLLDWPERIVVQGVPIGWPQLATALDRVMRAKGDTPLTPFERLTAAAFLVYAAARPDVVILEVGLGGRLDATRVARPGLVLVTNVGMDHADRLGGTLEAIAAEKAGALEPGRLALTTVTGPALRVLRAHAVTCGAALLELPSGPRAGTVAWAGRRLRGVVPSLTGRHQRDNLHLAACAALTMDALGWLRVPDDAVRQGAATTRWPGRLQLLPGAPAVLLDGAHNGPAARALAECLRAGWPGRRLRLLVGLLQDKDPPEVLGPLLPLVAEVTLVRPPGPRGRAPGSLRPFVGHTPCVVSERSPANALAELRERAGPDDLIVVTGSLYVVGEVLAGAASWSPAGGSW